MEGDMTDEQRESLRRFTDREREALLQFDQRQHDEREFYIEFQRRVSDRRDPAKPNKAVDKVLEFLEREDAELYVDLAIRGITLANRFVYVWAAVAGIIGLAMIFMTWWRDLVHFLASWEGAHPPAH